MSKTARWLVGLGSVVALVALFLVLRPKDDEPGPGPSPTATSPTATPTGTETAAPTGEPSPTLSPTETATPDALEVEVEVEEGRIEVKREGEDVSGGRVRVAHGERVLIVVEADRADEVHLHGYDIAAQVAPGAPARIRFTADVAGIFEVELEGSGTVLFELEVRP